MGSGLLILMVFSLLVGVSSGENGAKEHFDNGVDYASEGKFIQARDEFKESLKIDPRHRTSKNSLKTIEDAIAIKVKKEAAMHLYKSMVFNSKKMLDRSISEVTNAIEIDPRGIVAYNNRGLVYMVNLEEKTKGCDDWKRAYKLGKV